MWAHKSLADKNKLTAADALAVEEAFQARLEALGVGSAHPSQAAELPTAYEPIETTPKPKSRRRSHAIEKSVLAIPEPRRVRDRDHVRSVAQHPCLICGRRPADAHHLRFAQSKALGRKVSDEFTVPLCRGHHREVHRCGDEAAWWRMPVSTRPLRPARFGSKATRSRSVSKPPRRLSSSVRADCQRHRSYRIGFGHGRIPASIRAYPK